MIAILLVLGLGAGPLDARALDTPATAALTVSIEECDEAADFALLIPVVTPIDEIPAMASRIRSDLPSHYEHCFFLFRPPRAPAFH
jgi:hypothetical protein